LTFLTIILITTEPKKELLQYIIYLGVIVFCVRIMGVLLIHSFTHSQAKWLT
jgi:hypothetical protein